MQQARRSRHRVQPNELQHLHGWEERASSQHDHQWEESHCPSRYHHHQTPRLIFGLFIYPSEQIRLVCLFFEEFSCLQTMWKIRKKKQSLQLVKIPCVPVYILLWIRIGSGLLVLIFPFVCLIVYLFIFLLGMKCCCDVLNQILQCAQAEPAVLQGICKVNQEVQFTCKNRHRVHQN